MQKIILLLVVYLSSASILWAVELDVQVEKAIWRYQEDSKGDAVNMVQYPVKANGNGALAKLRISSERNQAWFAGLTTSMLSSTAWTDEVWQATNANELRVQQLDTRLDLQYRMLGARFGVWLAQRKQTQERRNFYTKKVLVFADPVSDEISTDWFGLSLTSVGGNVGQFEMSIDAAAPINVKLNSTRFNQPFTKRDGYRTGVHFRWTLPRQEVGVSGLNLTLRYEYQELGGEASVSNGFWPYNRWHMATAGILYAW